MQLNTDRKAPPRGDYEEVYMRSSPELSAMPFRPRHTNRFQPPSLLSKWTVRKNKLRFLELSLETVVHESKVGKNTVWYLNSQPKHKAMALQAVVAGLVFD